MPLPQTFQRTNTGMTPGAPVTTAEYLLLGTGVPDYVSTGDDHGIAVTVANLAAGVSGMVRGNAALDSRTASYTVDIRFTGVPSQSGVITEIRNATAQIANLLVLSSGGQPTLAVRHASNVTITGWPTGVGVLLDIGVWYRVQVTVDAGTTATNGRLKAQITRLSDGVVLASGESTGIDEKAAVVSHFQGGKNNTAGTMPVWLDNIAFTDAAGYAYIPAAVEVIAPIVVSSPQTGIEPGDKVTLGSTGGTTAQTWTQTGGPTVTLTRPTPQTATFIAPHRTAAAVLTFARGGVSTTVSVLPADRLRRVAGVWKPVRRWRVTA